MSELVHRKHNPLRDEELNVELNRYCKNNDDLEPEPSDVWKSLLDLPWGLRLTFLVNLIFPAPSYMRFRYKPGYELLLPFYYLKRMLRILSKVFFRFVT